MAERKVADMKLLVVQNDEDTQLVRNDEFLVNFNPRGLCSRQ